MVLKEGQTNTFYFEATHKSEKINFKIFLFEDNTYHLYFPIIGEINEQSLKDWNKGNIGHNYSNVCLYSADLISISNFILEIYEYIHEIDCSPKNKENFNSIISLEEGKSCKIKSIDNNPQVEVCCYYKS